MATPTKIHLTTKDTGVVKSDSPTQESANKANECLQKNHDDFHIYFNKDGFHNHIAHHLLTLYGLGTPAQVIEKHFQRNATYQLPARPVKQENVREMKDVESFKSYLGKGERYHDFLVFFQDELERRGVEAVLNEYLFSGTELADDLLVRLFAGFYHPLIHLGFGLEFSQPAIVAEALAEICVHDSSWLGPFLFTTEKAAKSNTNKSLPTLLDEIYADKELSTAADWSDGNKIRDGILARAPEAAIKYASQWTVTPETLQQKTVEMINTVVYFTACAQHPPKEVKIDFYFMHCVNSSIFWTTFNALPWLSVANKVRLLEWKGRQDLIMYASRRSPKLLLEEVTTYVPKGKKTEDTEWKGIFRRLKDYDDDGHAIKLARAVVHAENLSREWETEDWCRIKVSNEMFLKIGNMVVDSVEAPGASWGRSVGFEEAWVDYVDRPTNVHL